MFITKMSLPRRTFLRARSHRRAAVARRDGAGRDGADGRRPDHARGFIYIRTARTWRRGRRRAAGRGFEFSPSLQPLAPFKESLTVISNLSRAGGQSAMHAAAAWAG